MSQLPLKYYGKLTINPGSWQRRGLVYWISPWLERAQGFHQQEKYKYIQNSLFSYYPKMVADGEMGWVYLIDGTEQGYLNRRFEMDYITCSAWIKGGNQSAAAMVINGDDLGSNRNFQFRINVNVLEWIVFKRGGGLDSISGAITVNDSIWHHIAATWDGATIITYVDGKQDASKAYSGLLNNSVGGYYIFGSSSEFYYVGRTHDYRIYNRALSAEEIFALYDAKSRWDLYQPVTQPIWSISGVIAGSTCWGHSTGVAEANTRTFSGNWTGTGEISGSGDAETICLNASEYMESEVVNTGTLTVELDQNVYAAGDDILLRYRHGASEAACLAAAWNNYTIPFDSSGYVQVRIESTL